MVTNHPILPCCAMMLPSSCIDRPRTTPSPGPLPDHPGLCVKDYSLARPRTTPLPGQGLLTRPLLGHTAMHSSYADSPLCGRLVSALVTSMWWSRHLQSNMSYGTVPSQVHSELHSTMSSKTSNRLCNVQSLTGDMLTGLHGPSNVVMFADQECLPE